MIMRVVATVALTACVTPHVMSPFGDLCGVNHMPDDSCHPRDKPHDAVDFGPASVGDPVIASADGSVLSVTFDPDAGTEVVLLHDRYAPDHESRGAPYRSGYLHLDIATVKPGDRVHRGQIVGEVGLFRNSARIPHVHWRLWRAGETIDPLSKTIGCFDRSSVYSDSKLELTFPLPC
jgi:murein DD-endopeptidase MepM/ murein hydrolase activator NlpD